MTHHRRGIMLVEMLVVLFLVGTGGTVITLGVLSILKSQDRVSDFANRYATTQDFLDTVSRDARAVTTASLHRAESSDVQVLTLGEPNRQTVYRFYSDRVERTASAGMRAAAKSWPVTAEAALLGSSRSPGAKLLKATVFWHRPDVHELDPARRFDVTVRCVGENGEGGTLTP